MVLQILANKKQQYLKWDKKKISSFILKVISNYTLSSYTLNEWTNTNASSLTSCFHSSLSTTNILYSYVLLFWQSNVHTGKKKCAINITSNRPEGQRAHKGLLASSSPQVNSPPFHNVDQTCNCLLRACLLYRLTAPGGWETCDSCIPQYRHRNGGRMGVQRILIT